MVEQNELFPELTCVVLASFTSRGTGLTLVPAVTNVLKEFGIQTIWFGSDLNPPAPTAGVVQRAILEADLIVADVGGASRSVMYEVGFAHALKKPILLVSERGKEIPSELQGFLVVMFDPENYDELLRYLRAWASQFANTNQWEPVRG